MIDFNNTPLNNAIKGIKGTINHPKFILWLLNDETYGILKVITGSIPVKESIESKLYLYEEWIKTGIRPSLLSAKYVKMSGIGYGIGSLLEVVSIGAINYISRRSIGIHRKIQDGSRSIQILQEIQLQKINQLLSEDELFTEQDYLEDSYDNSNI